MSQEPLIHLLFIEDDGRLAELTIDYLRRHAVSVDWQTDGLRGLRAALAQRYDAILLDLMLPGLDGVEICRRIRQRSDVPILMITARGEEADRVIGLEIGADDYVAKPFAPRELLARVRTSVRRARGQQGPRDKQIVQRGDLLLDPGAHTARLKGRAIELTSYEFCLLLAMVERAGRVLSREQLMDLAKGNAEEAFDRSIDVHISRLRQKLGDDPRRPRRIRTVRGVGYQYMTEKKS